MISSLISKVFNSAPVLDDNSKAWILDSFDWALAYLDQDFFEQSTQLVLPTNEFYPGRVNSVEEMAKVIFDKTKEYAGLSQWPIVPAAPQSALPTAIPNLGVGAKSRGQEPSFALASELRGTIPVRIHPQQVNQVQDLIGYLVQTLVNIYVNQMLVNQTVELPPGGEETAAQRVDLIAVFLGFGVIFSNTAYQFKGGCGSCNNASLNRQAGLPEVETLYALSVFCHHKSIKPSTVLPHLKSHLKSSYKRCVKEVANDIAKRQTGA